MKLGQTIMLQRLSKGGVVWRRVQRGVTSIEYALVGALIAMVIFGVVTTLGLTLEDFYTRVSDEVTKAAPSGGD